MREPGVALSWVGAKMRITRTVAIADNAHLSTKWSASSDQPWLRVDPATGTTDGKLTLSASAAALPDGLHYARVTIAPRDEAAVEKSSVVRVGLYLDSTTSSRDPPWYQLQGKLRTRPVHHEPAARR